MRDIGSVENVAAVSKSDTPGASFTLPAGEHFARGLYIGGAGNVSINMPNGTGPVVLTALAVGVWHPIRVKDVLSTSTTATAILVGF